MKVKMIKNQKVNPVVELQKGTIFEVRVFSELPLQFNAPFQIIDGDHSGIIIPREYCIEVKDETKALTESDWKAREDYYLARLNKEKEEKERAQQLIRDLTEQLKLKNKEIGKLEFFLNALRQTVIFFAFNNKEMKEYNQQNG
jgi:hypothetical protein